MSTPSSPMQVEANVPIDVKVENIEKTVKQLKILLLKMKKDYDKDVSVNPSSGSSIENDDQLAAFQNLQFLVNNLAADVNEMKESRTIMNEYVSNEVLKFSEILDSNKNEIQKMVDAAIFNKIKELSDTMNAHAAQIDLLKNENEELKAEKVKLSEQHNDLRQQMNQNVDQLRDQVRVQTESEASRFTAYKSEIQSQMTTFKNDFDVSFRENLDKSKEVSKQIQDSQQEMLNQFQTLKNRLSTSDSALKENTLRIEAVFKTFNESKEALESKIQFIKSSISNIDEMGKNNISKIESMSQQSKANKEKTDSDIQTIKGSLTRVDQMCKACSTKTDEISLQVQESNAKFEVSIQKLQAILSSTSENTKTYTSKIESAFQQISEAKDQFGSGILKIKGQISDMDASMKGLSSKMDGFPLQIVQIQENLNKKTDQIDLLRQTIEKNRIEIEKSLSQLKDVTSFINKDEFELHKKSIRKLKSKLRKIEQIDHAKQSDKAETVSTTSAENNKDFIISEMPVNISEPLISKIQLDEVESKLQLSYNDLAVSINTLQEQLKSLNEKYVQIAEKELTQIADNHKKDMVSMVNAVNELRNPQIIHQKLVSEEEIISIKQDLNRLSNNIADIDAFKIRIINQQGSNTEEISMIKNNITKIADLEKSIDYIKRQDHLSQLHMIMDKQQRQIESIQKSIPLSIDKGQQPNSMVRTTSMDSTSFASKSDLVVFEKDLNDLRNQIENITTTNASDIDRVSSSLFDLINKTLPNELESIKKDTKKLRRQVKKFSNISSTEEPLDNNDINECPNMADNENFNKEMHELKSQMSVRFSQIDLLSEEVNQMKQCVIKIAQLEQTIEDIRKQPVSSQPDISSEELLQIKQTIEDIRKQPVSSQSDNSSEELLQIKQTIEDIRKQPVSSAPSISSEEANQMKQCVIKIAQLEQTIEDIRKQPVSSQPDISSEELIQIKQDLSKIAQIEQSFEFIKTEQAGLVQKQSDQSQLVSNNYQDVSELKSRFSEINQSLDQFKFRVCEEFVQKSENTLKGSQLSESINQIILRLDAYHEDFGGFKSELEDINNRFDLHINDKQLASDMISISNKIDSFSEDVERLSKLIESLNHSTTINSQEIMELNKSVVDIQKSNDATGEQMQKNVRRLMEDFAAISSEKIEQEQNIPETIEQMKSDFGERFDSIEKSSKDQLLLHQQQLENLRVATDTLMSNLKTQQNVASQEDIVSLRDNLENSISSLRDQLNLSVNEEIEQYISQIKNVSEQHNSLTVTFDSFMSSNEQKLQSYQTENNRFKETISLITQKISSIETSLEQMRTSVDLTNNDRTSKEEIEDLMKGFYLKLGEKSESRDSLPISSSQEISNQSIDLSRVYKKLSKLKSKIADLNHRIQILPNDSPNNPQISQVFVDLPTVAAVQLVFRAPQP